MKIAFYAPLKAPDHPVPSGDRRMARAFMAALRRAGHSVTLASALRARLPDAGDRAAYAVLTVAARAEQERLRGLWRSRGAPDIWFCYHPYYKSPDLIGPALCREFGLQWISAEASLSARRNIGIWTETQTLMRDAIAAAGVNLALTARDADGLAAQCPEARIARIAPFLDTDALPPASVAARGQLVTIAMMRPGDKLDSYYALATALRDLRGDWRLDVAGSGSASAGVHARFEGLPVQFSGQLEPPGIAALLARAAVYAWPGCGEAYGLAYLEAAAAGVPSVAFNTAGVPEVVADGETGILVPDGDTRAFAAALSLLLEDAGLRNRLAEAARARVAQRHTLMAAATAIDTALRAMETPQ